MQTLIIDNKTIKRADGRIEKASYTKAQVVKGTPNGKKPLMLTFLKVNGKEIY